MADTLMIGDPLCTIGEDNVSRIIVIRALQIDSKDVQWIPTNSLECAKVTGREIALKEMEGNYVWDGKGYGSSDLLYQGKSCLPLAPTIGESDSLFIFDRQLVLDLGVQLQLNENHEGPTAVSAKNQRKCKLCQKSIDIKHMRIHVGQHILKNPQQFGGPTICGFCGKSTCNVDLKNTSKKGGDKKFKVNSSCDFNSNFNLKSAEKVTRKMPCCNRPVMCPFEGCKRCIWSYNMEPHYQQDHCSEDTPAEFLVGSEEKNAVLKFNKF